MRYRVIPLFSAKAEAILFEVYDEAGHCVIFEADELRDLGAEIGEKVIFDNIEISPEAARRAIEDGRRSAEVYARLHGLL